MVDQRRAEYLLEAQVAWGELPLLACGPRFLPRVAPVDQSRPMARYQCYRSDNRSEWNRLGIGKVHIISQKS